VHLAVSPLDEIVQELPPDFRTSQHVGGKLILTSLNTAPANHRARAAVMGMCSSGNFAGSPSQRIAGRRRPRFLCPYFQSSNPPKVIFQFRSEYIGCGMSYLRANQPVSALDSKFSIQESALGLQPCHAKRRQVLSKRCRPRRSGVDRTPSWC
jgi:hypothetical protein